MRIIAVIPTFNEAGTIRGLVQSLLALRPDLDVLVVDGNSTDQTVPLVEAMASADKRVVLLKQPARSRLGQAYALGFSHALCAGAYDRIIQMDADLSHDPAFIAALVEATDDHSVAIGSRYIRGGRASGRSLYRNFLSSLACLYARGVVGLRVRDCTGGFRCFRSEALRAIDFGTTSKGYFFQVDILARCLRNGCSWKEVPIVFCERSRGRSKMHFREIWDGVWDAVRIAGGRCS